METFVLDEQTAQRVVRMLRWFERRPDSGPDGETDDSGYGNWQIVRVTGSVVVDGGINYYPGQVTFRSEPDATWEDTDGTCWIEGANNEELTNGERYACRQTGNKELSSDERPCFVAAVPC